jgi:hypothetical protein
MGKFLNYLKMYSFGGYKTGLYNKNAITFGSLISVILSILFILGLITSIGYYVNEIFFVRTEYINEKETQLLSETELFSYSIPQAL